jgi:hypothetical protein
MRVPRLPARLRVGRLLAAGAICAIAVGYVQPIRAYMEAEEQVGAKRAERASLLRQQARLRARLELAGSEAFVLREARRIQLVRRGETLYVVNGVQRWKREAAERAAAKR